MVPPPGVPAQFAFRTLLSGVHVDFQIRNGTDYGVTARVTGVSESVGLLTSSVRIWGVPGDPGHDALRFTGAGVPVPGPYPEPPPYRSLLSNPTSCDGPFVTTMEASIWQRPEQTISAPAFEAPGMLGCNQLEFDPTIEAKPSTNLADSPTGLNLNLHVPQAQDPEGSASSHLRTARFVLPAGLDVNPSAANGLGTCDLEQIGFVGRSNGRQLLRYDMPPGNFSGSFKVTFDGRSTAPIAATATRSEVTAALETLPGLAGNVSLSGAQGGWIVTFTGALASTRVPLLAGTVTENPSEIIAVTGEGGTFELHLGGAATGPLPFDASAAEVQAALRAIPALGRGNLFPGNVFVPAVGINEPTRSYQVLFVGDLAGTSPSLTATSALTGPGAGVTIKLEDPPPPSPLSVAALGGIAPGSPQFSAAAATCPDNAKIGTVRIDSPAVLDHPVFGNVFLADQDRNPFGSLLAFYIAVADPASGLALKLPGKVETDPGSGRLVATISEAPQLPFEDLQLELFRGTAAPLKTGLACGTYVVESEMTPWAAPEGAVRRPSDSFAIEKGAAAGPCANDAATAPETTKFEAGTVDPVAGTYSPFVLRLSRQDGGRLLSGVNAALPPGLLARVAGTQLCPEDALAAAAGHSGGQERSGPSCPAASQVGSVAIAAGAGPAPDNVSGTVYLAGPYKGAPYSLAAVTPVLAGPFDLGTVVLRSALFLDPRRAQVRVASDPFPAALRGIPVDLRSVVLRLDAARFTRNPTSCNPLAIAGRDGLPDARFQVGDCGKLAFKPKLGLAFVGAAKRGGHPILKATLSFPAKGNSANVAAASLTLPKTEVIDKSRIKAICSRAQVVNDACPAAGAYGSIKVFTPLLADPLEGRIYLVKSTGKLPDLIADLEGPVDALLEGRLAMTKAGALSVGFEEVPDVPVSKVALELRAAKGGLLRNTANLCARVRKGTALIDGQNGASSNQTPVFTATCKKKGRRG
jgi:hypothetical protein